jgi:hypothetical protein
MRRVDKAGLNRFSRTPPEKIIDHSTMQGILSTQDGLTDSTRYNRIRRPPRNSGDLFQYELLPSADSMAW